MIDEDAEREWKQAVEQAANLQVMLAHAVTTDERRAAADKMAHVAQRLVLWGFCR